MPPLIYESYRLHEVVRDVVERAGIEEYSIDTSVLGRERILLLVSPCFFLLFLQ